MAADITLPGPIGDVVHCVDPYYTKWTLCGKFAGAGTPVDMGVKVHRRCRQCIDADPFWSVVLGGRQPWEPNDQPE